MYRIEGSGTKAQSFVLRDRKWGYHTKFRMPLPSLKQGLNSLPRVYQAGRPILFRIPMLEAGEVWPLQSCAVLGTKDRRPMSLISTLHMFMTMGWGVSVSRTNFSWVWWRTGSSEEFTTVEDLWERLSPAPLYNSKNGSEKRIQT